MTRCNLWRTCYPIFTRPFVPALSAQRRSLSLEAQRLRDLWWNVDAHRPWGCPCRVSARKKKIYIWTDPFILSPHQHQKARVKSQSNRGMSRLVPRAFHSSRDQPTPADHQKPLKPILRRGSTSNHEQRPLVRTNSRDNGSGQRRDADGGKRSRNRSNSLPPENKTHYHALQDGGTRLITASANASRAFAENWANTSWCPRTIQVSGRLEMVVHGGQLGDVDDHRGRARRSSLDAKRPTPVHSAPAPRSAHPPPSSPAEPPVIPGSTTSGGMGLRNLLRKNSRDRPKILFYSKYDPYYGFTNFSPHPVTFKGKEYPTSEHLFQALKVSGRFARRCCGFLFIPVDLFAALVHS